MIVWIWLYMAVCLSVLQVHSVDPCEEHKTCQACVRATPACKWCSSIKFKNSQRCVSARTDFSECPNENIENPKGSVSATDYDQDFSNVTQIKPQRFKIKLRPGETQTFNFSFKPSRNFPADLYFLLDSSNTMTNTLRATASAAKGIYDSMKRNTEDVFIGMGTFIDKNAAPFVREKNLSDPISSYTHKLNLTNDIGLFEKLVNDLASKTKKNYDNREGGFDALAQAITCNIGWRAMSRKIIFFFTDNLSHTAGDGKFAGIIYPYDGECYTDVNGKYTKELEMDYPSIGMISELAQREGVTIIFLAEKLVQPMYKNIARHIHGSQVVYYQSFQTIIFEGLTSLDKVLSKIYRNITKTIKFDTIMTPKEQKHVKLTFEPNCTVGKNDPKCTVSIKKQKLIDFQGNITLSNYYEEDQIQFKISIGSGIKEKLILDIEVVDCDCEDEEKKSTYCDGHGTKRCGACECDENRIGDKCECMQNKDDHDESSCKPGSDKDHLPCNGEGTCKCGTCKCNHGREGKFCECIKDNCVDNCNGHDHGRCYCGVCTCKEGWSGEYCGCSKKPCISIHGKTCNGRGSCHCGSCKCEDRAAWDARVYQNRDTCEMNPCENCHIDQCLKLEECAKCSINEEADCSKPCGGGIIIKLIDHLNGTTNDSICENVKVGIGCYTRLSYKYDDVNYQIHLLVQREKSCLESYYRFGGSILVALVVIGLATLFTWKVLTDRRDRREYQQFLKQHGADRDESCQNPIYEPASTTIRNPAFRKPSVDFTLQ